MPAQMSAPAAAITTIRHDHSAVARTAGGTTWSRSGDDFTQHLRIFRALTVQVYLPNAADSFMVSEYQANTCISPIPLDATPRLGESAIHRDLRNESPPYHR